MLQSWGVLVSGFTLAVGMTITQAAFELWRIPHLHPSLFYFKEKKNSDFLLKMQIVPFICASLMSTLWVALWGGSNGEITNIPELFLEMGATAVSIASYIHCHVVKYNRVSSIANQHSVKISETT